MVVALKGLRGGSTCCLGLANKYAAIDSCVRISFISLYTYIHIYMYFLHYNTHIHSYAHTYTHPLILWWAH